MGTEFRITASLVKGEEKPSNKRIKIALDLLGLEHVSIVSLPIRHCDWQTANTLTDYIAVKCRFPATHWINDSEEPGLTYLCLPHADLYRSITDRVPEALK
jgi:hypothetical protein